ncbi:hypothetical protein ACFPTY_06730 [Halomonas beimenensis]|uniref:Uncharacterized protein n=1 Tax=Halomonas beimenensis TaxID=475662 RepID=A0A291P721_9GAMM|nr:hypothetical protein [Halomonas beimenensis]ATJ82675.1 hypothetical protein BEI_1688 [Halomonas beimenensis]
MNFFCIVLFSVIAISGNSVPVIIFSYALSAVFLVILLKAGILIRLSSLLCVVFSFLIFIPLAFVLPLGNTLKFVLAVSSILVAAIPYTYIKTLGLPTQQNIFKWVLNIFLLGSFLHASGVLGDNMEVYKNFVHMPQLGNLARESSLSFFNQRFFGFFMEPSYFAAYFSLACSALFIVGARTSSLIYFFVGFLLCPSPNFFIGIAVVFYAFRNIIVATPKHFVLSTLFVVIVISLQTPRLIGFFNDILFFLDGGYRLTSFSHRLILPLVDFVAAHGDGEIPLDYACVSSFSCSHFLSKIPVITFWSFFSFAGVISYLLFVRAFLKKSFFSIALFFLISSIFSGGSAFVPHFALIFVMSVGFLNVVNRHTPSELLNSKLRSAENLHERRSL